MTYLKFDIKKKLSKKIVLIRVNKEKLEFQFKV